MRTASRTNAAVTRDAARPIAPPVVSQRFVSTHNEFRDCLLASHVIPGALHFATRLHDRVSLRCATQPALRSCRPHSFQPETHTFIQKCPPRRRLSASTFHHLPIRRCLRIRTTSRPVLPSLQLHTQLHHRAVSQPQSATTCTTLELAVQTPMSATPSLPFRNGRTQRYCSWEESSEPSRPTAAHIPDVKLAR